MVMATISGPLSSTDVVLTIENDGSEDVAAFGISGRTSRFPVTWDNFSGFSSLPTGSATRTNTVGVDSEVVLVEFSGFIPGESVVFDRIEGDFTGDPNSGVRVGDIAGSQAMVRLSNGITFTGEFRPDGNGSLVAEIQID